GLTTGTVTGINPDGTINGGPTNIDAAAYTNVQPTTGGVTTLYTLDSTLNALYIQNPANTGTQTMALPLGVDFGTVNGFDIPEGVKVATANAPAVGNGF